MVIPVFSCKTGREGDRVNSRNVMQAGKKPLIVAVAALQSVFMAALLLLSAYDGARQPLAPLRLAFSPAALAVEPGSLGKQEGLRQLFAPDQNARSKARIIDPPDIALCRTSCLVLPGQASGGTVVPANLILPTFGCCAFQPRAPPQVIL
jgi:hypothetical protein